MKTKVSDLLPYKRTRYQEAMNAYVPREAIISLSQEKDSICTVSHGDVVEEGQILATSRELHGSVVHSSLPGVVSEIGYITDTDGRRVHAVKVRLKGEFSLFGKPGKAVDWKSLSPGTIRRIIAGNGVVNTFGRTVSLVQQMDRLMEKGKPTLVVRLFDLDPSCTVDQFIAEQFSQEVMAGIGILAAALETKRVVVLLSQDFRPKEELIMPEGTVEYITMSIDTSYYPVGGKRDIIGLVNRKRRESRINFRDLFVDSSTLLDVYEAVVYNQPVVDRFVQISGRAVYGEGILKVRLGTPIRSLVAETGGFATEAAKIVVNGVLMGHNVTDLDTPVTKEVKSIVIMASRDVMSQTAAECIRCGMCRHVCPMGMSPDILYGHYAFRHEIVPEYLNTLRDCSDCVLCNAVCPARLPLCQSIKLLRGAVNEKK